MKLPLHCRHHVLGLMVVIAAVYGRSLAFPFQFDDGHSITQNEHIRSLANVPAYFSDPSMFSVDPSLTMYRPVVLTSYAINFGVSRLDPWSYHLLNVIIHLGVVLTIGGLAGQLTRSATAGWMAAWLFALHPVHSEAVYYVSSRSETLAALAALGTLLLVRHPARWAPAAAALTLAAGLASKSAAIAILPIILLHDVLVDPGAWRRRWMRHLMLWALAGLYLLQTRTIIAKATLTEPVRSYAEQIWTQAKALAYYLHLLVVPRDLSVDHQFLISDSPVDPYVVAAVAMIGSLLVLLLRAAVRLAAARRPLFLALWFLAALAPASLVPLNVLVNEHRLYLAGVALSIGLVLLVHGDRRARRSLCWALPLFALLSAGRGDVWASTESLWLDAAYKAPGMARPRIMLGQYYQRQGDDEKVIVHLTEALRLDSTFAPAYAALSDALLRRGQITTAVQVARRGASVLPDSVGMWSQLAQIERASAQMGGAASEQQAAYEATAAALQRALQLAPDDADLLNNLGNTYQVLARPQQALPYHERAVALGPERAISRLNYGNALLMLGELSAAAAQYELATRLAPDEPGGWVMRGIVRQRQGDREQAAVFWQRARALGWRGEGG